MSLYLVHHIPAHCDTCDKRCDRVEMWFDYARQCEVLAVECHGAKEQRFTKRRVLQEETRDPRKDLVFFLRPYGPSDILSLISEHLDF